MCYGMFKRVSFAGVALLTTMFFTLWTRADSCEKHCGVGTITGSWIRSCGPDVPCYVFECSQHAQGCGDHFNDFCMVPYVHGCYSDLEG